MSSEKKLQYFKSYKGNDSIMGSYSTELLDGTILIVQAVFDGVEYIFWKNGEEKVIKVSLENTSRQCIGITGFRTDPKENFVILIKEKANSMTQSYLVVVSIPSSSDVTEEELQFPGSRCRLDFIPTCLKEVCIPLNDKWSKPVQYIILGKTDGTAVVYVYHSEANRKLVMSESFGDFFPTMNSPLISLDSYNITPLHRIWAMGYGNGLVCVCFVTGFPVTERIRVKPLIREYGVLCENRPLTQQDRENPKLILLLHLSSPIHGVKLFLPYGVDTTSDVLRVDLFTTCYGKTLLWFEDILNQGLVQATPIPGLEVVSCVNCMSIVERVTKMEETQSANTREQLTGKTEGRLRKESSGKLEEGLIEHTVRGGDFGMDGSGQTELSLPLSLSSSSSSSVSNLMSGNNTNDKDTNMIDRGDRGDRGDPNHKDLPIQSKCPYRRFQVLLGDYANKVHAFQFSNEEASDRFGVRRIGELSLNDCIYQIHLLGNHCIVTTRQGVYIY